MTSDLATIIGILLIAFGTYMVYFGRKIGAKELQVKLDNQSAQLTEAQAILNSQSSKIDNQQSTIIDLGKNNAQLIEQSSQLLTDNKGIQERNIGLFDQNRDLTERIASYQLELEEKSAEIERLSSEEAKRSQKEQELEVMKITKPEAKVEPYIENGNLFMLFTLLNDVPISARYTFKRLDDVLVGGFLLSNMELNPIKGLRFNRNHGKISEFDKLIEDETELILTFEYWSKYASESTSSKLSGKTENHYLLNKKLIR